MFPEAKKPNRHVGLFARGYQVKALSAMQVDCKPMKRVKSYLIG